MSSFEILAQSDHCINLADCVLRGQCKEVFPIGQLFGPQVIPVASGNRVRYESRGPKASCQSLLRLFGKRMTWSVGVAFRNQDKSGISEERRVGKECVSTGRSRWSV